MRLFISYAHANHKKVKRLAELLQEVGYDVWFDEELRGGEDWWQGILEQIEQSEVVIYALSAQSKSSTACAAELKYAMRLNKIILPVRLENVEMPTDLKSVHYEDAFRHSYPQIALTLTRALNHLQKQLLMEQRAVDDSRPTRPLFPFPPDHLGDLRERSRKLEAAQPQDIVKMVFSLKQIARMSDPAASREARDLLRSMLDNPNITLAVREEILEALAGERQRWRLMGAAVAVVLVIVFGVVIVVGGKLLGNTTHIAQADPATSKPAEVSAAETAIPGEPVSLIFQYSSDQPLVLRFRTAARSLWLFGLELRWTDSLGQPQKVRLNDSYYTLPLHNLPASTCLEWVTPDLQTLQGCAPIALGEDQEFWWVEGGLFSVWQGERQIGVCANAEGRCEVEWSNTADDRSFAVAEMIMEWTGSDLITLRFETMEPTVDLSEVTFLVTLPNSSRRLYYLSSFTQLNSLPNFSIQRVPANACIVLGSNHNVVLPGDNRCVGGLFFDNRAIETTQGAFWDSTQAEFEVHAATPAATTSLLLGKCSTTANQCRVRLDK